MSPCPRASFSPSAWTGSTGPNGAKNVAHSSPLFFASRHFETMDRPRTESRQPLVQETAAGSKVALRIRATRGFHSSAGLHFSKWTVDVMRYDERGAPPCQCRFGACWRQMDCETVGVWEDYSPSQSGFHPLFLAPPLLGCRRFLRGCYVSSRLNQVISSSR